MTAPDGSPQLLWSDLLALEPGRGYALVRAARSGTRTFAVLVVPSDAPGPSPVNAYEEVLELLTGALGGTPDDVLIAFPEFDDDEWIHATGAIIEDSTTLTNSEAVALVGSELAALPPPERCRCADLAPGHPLLAFVPEPEPEHSPLQDLVVVDVAALPWPHKPFRCAHRERFDELREHYPQGALETGVIGAHWTTTLSSDDQAACRYHDVDWAAAAAAAAEILKRSQLRELADVATHLRLHQLAEPEAEAALSLFRDPITWTPKTTYVTNGQHRLCAIRLSGATRCVIDTGGIPTDKEPAATPQQLAARAIADYWSAIAAP